MSSAVRKENLINMAFYSAAAVAINLVGNQATRAITKSPSPFSGSIVGGIASGLSCEISYIITGKYFKGHPNKYEKRHLCHILVLLLAGGGVPLALSLLTGSKVSIITSIGYSILGLLGTEIGCILQETYYRKSYPLNVNIDWRVGLYANAFDYLIGKEV